MSYSLKTILSITLYLDIQETSVQRPWHFKYIILSDWSISNCKLCPHHQILSLTQCLEVIFMYILTARIYPSISEALCCVKLHAILSMWFLECLSMSAHSVTCPLQSSSSFTAQTTWKHSSKQIKKWQEWHEGPRYKKRVGIRTDLILECVFDKIHVNVQMYKNSLWRGKMFSATSGSADVQ